MTDINNVISEINRYQYNIKKGVISELAKLDTREFIEKEYEILESLYNKKDDEVAKEIKTLLGIDTDKKNWNDVTDNFLEMIKRINKASMVYDKLFLIDLNCKYHVLYSEDSIKTYNNEPVDINEGNNFVILDRHNTHARIINYDNNEVNYIDIPRRNFALSQNKLIRGSEYTLDDEVNKNVHKMKCDDVPWLCNGLYHSIYHSIKNVKDYDNLNIVIPIININYRMFMSISGKMIELLKDGTSRTYYYSILRDGQITNSASIDNYCNVYMIDYDNKRITIIGLVLFDRINYINSIFKDISDDYKVIVKFIGDDTFNKIKDNYTKFPTFVYKMYCLNYAVKHYSNYHTTIIDLYYATKLVFFSCFNNCFEGNIDKKNITELTDNQKSVAKEILKHYLNNDFVFTVHVDNINQHWLNLDDLNKLDPDNYKTSTGDIKIPNFVIDSEQYKLEDVISKSLEEIRDEISHLYTIHSDFENMINDVIENESIPQSNQRLDVIESIKQFIGNNTKKLVCIPVFCMNRYTSSINYKLMESVINNINKKIKEKAGVKEDTL